MFGLNTEVKFVLINFNKFRLIYLFVYNISNTNIFQINNTLKFKIVILNLDVYQNLDSLIKKIICHKLVIHFNIHDSKFNLPFKKRNILRGYFWSIDYTLWYICQIIFSNDFFFLLKWNLIVWVLVRIKSYCYQSSEIMNEWKRMKELKNGEYLYNFERYFRVVPPFNLFLISKLESVVKSHKVMKLFLSTFYANIYLKYILKNIINWCLRFIIRAGK